MINNSGSYFLIQMALICFTLFKIAINMLAKLMKKSHYARRMGMSFFEDEYLSNLNRSSVKLFIESYFDLVFCASINLYALFQNKNISDLRSFFETPLDVLSSCLTIIYCILLITYPIFGFVLIRKN